MTQERTETSVAPDPRYALLAAALRVGARTGPQCTGVLFRNTASCALGALAIGLVGYRSPNIVAVIRDCLGLDLDAIQVCLPPVALQETWISVCPAQERSLRDAIVFLNDGVGWTRECIADWLDSLGHAACP